MPGTPVQVFTYFPELTSDFHQGLLWGTVCVCVLGSSQMGQDASFLHLPPSPPYSSVPGPVPWAKDTQMVQK